MRLSIRGWKILCPHLLITQTRRLTQNLDWLLFPPPNEK
jgi:hypothetical protein